MRRSRITAALVLAALSLPPIALADAQLQELPHAKRYVSKLDPATTWLELQADPGGRFAFNLMTHTNGHYCTLTGLAKAQKDDSLRFQQGDCRMTIKQHGVKVQVIDVEDRCKPLYCGLNATIGRLDLGLDESAKKPEARE